MRYFALYFFKIKLVFVLLVLPPSCSAKRNTISESERAQQIILIDSLRQVILQDTIRFNESEFVFTQLGRKNLDSYSMLYIVNGTYLYKLDIISSDRVVEFVNEILNPDIIQNIVVFSRENVATAMLGGVRAQNGIVLITTKRRANFNPFVAGLERRPQHPNGRNNNFFADRKDNEIMIRE